MSAALLLAALTAGLLGSLHCAGMCGPLAVLVAGSRCRRPALPLSLFVGGKALTYIALGAAAGTLGGAFGAHGFGGNALAVVALAAGTAMVAIGAHTLWRRLPTMQGRRPSAVSVLLGAVVRSRSPLAPVAAGSLAGLLPCGLVYAMIAQSLALASPLEGAALMLAFASGTAPSLLAAGWLGRRMSGASRLRGERVAAAAVIAMGIVAVWRGLAVLTADPASAAMMCHCS